jgi:hypothetical protein
LNTIYVDPKLPDRERRQHLFKGQLMIFSPTPSSLALVEHARSMIEGAFGDLDPETAQKDMAVEAYAKLLADLKPAFIHHPRSKECIQGMMTELGCDPAKTYFDVPRMRTSTSDNYLTSGIAYAFHPVAAQLVAPHLRGPIRQRDGDPPALLEPADQEQLVRLQLLSMECDGT